MNLTSNERALLAGLNNRSLIQCVANCKELGNFFPNALNGIRITKGLIGGLEAKGLLSAELCIETSLRHLCFQLSDIGKQVVKGLTSNA